MNGVTKARKSVVRNSHASVRRERLEREQEMQRQQEEQRLQEIVRGKKHVSSSSNPNPDYVEEEYFEEVEDQCQKKKSNRYHNLDKLGELVCHNNNFKAFLVDRQTCRCYPTSTTTLLHKCGLVRTARH